MTRRPLRAHLPRRTEQTLRMIQDSETILRLLTDGAVATPIGPNTTLRIDANRAATFPTELVDEVRRRMQEAANGR